MVKWGIYCSCRDVTACANTTCIFRLCSIKHQVCATTHACLVVGLELLQRDTWESINWVRRKKTCAAPMIPEACYIKTYDKLSLHTRTMMWAGIPQLRTRKREVRICHMHVSPLQSSIVGNILNRCEDVVTSCLLSAESELKSQEFFYSTK